MTQLFNSEDQLKVTQKFISFIDFMRTARNVKEWNEYREDMKEGFNGDLNEKLMFLGYVDGVLFTEVKKTF